MNPRFDRVTFAGLCVAALLAGSARAAPSEYELKAAFLVNVVRFVEWPKTPTDAASVVVVEPDPFGAILDADAGDASLPLRLTVKRASGGAPVPAARILFCSKASGAAGLAAMARAWPSTLTVGETEDFLAHGGIVWLAIVDGHLHIEINVDAAERSGLRISSRLLQLATRRHESELR